MRSLSVWLVLLTCGCSVSWGHPVPTDPARGQVITCYADGPVADALWLAAIVGVTVAVLALGDEDPVEPDENNDEKVAVLWGAAGAGVLGSAIYGTVQYARCNRLRNRTAAERETDADVAAAKKVSRERAWLLTKEATSAAIAGDCPRVKSLETEVERLDPEFLTSVFLRDVGIVRCLR